jgi:hypothetical protein
MTITLHQDVQEKLLREASRLGVPPEEFARRAIEEKLAASDATGRNQALLDVLDEWDREDATDDDAEIARRQQDFEEFKRAINSSHSSDRKIYP